MVQSFLTRASIIGPNGGERHQRNDLAALLGVPNSRANSILLPTLQSEKPPTPSGIPVGQSEDLHPAGLTMLGCAVCDKKAHKTTKPGWFARLSTCGTGSFGLVSIADPECRDY